MVFLKILVPSSFWRMCRVKYRLSLHCSNVIQLLMRLEWLLQCIQCGGDGCFPQKLPFSLAHVGHCSLPWLLHPILAWPSSCFLWVDCTQGSSSCYLALQPQKLFFRAILAPLDQADHQFRLHAPRNGPNMANDLGLPP